MPRGNPTISHLQSKVDFNNFIDDYSDEGCQYASCYNLVMSHKPKSKCLKCPLKICIEDIIDKQGCGHLKWVYISDSLNNSFSWMELSSIWKNHCGKPIRAHMLQALGLKSRYVEG